MDSHGVNTVEIFKGLGIKSSRNITLYLKIDFILLSYSVKNPMKYQIKYF
jgi:hypothetical protein